MGALTLEKLPKYRDFDQILNLDYSTDICYCFSVNKDVY